MLSDTDAGRMANAVSMCLRKEKIKFFARPKDGTNKDHDTHAHKSYERLKAG